MAGDGYGGSYGHAMAVAMDGDGGASYVKAGGVVLWLCVYRSLLML